MKRRCFFCSTPYQIIVACQIVNQYYLDGFNDIYILNHFENHRDIAYRLKEVSIFDNVYTVPSIELELQAQNENRFIRLYSYCKNYLESHSILKKAGVQLHYDEVYFSYPSTIIKLFLLANRSIKINCFEDGTGSYFYEIESFFNKIDKLLLRGKKVANLFLFKPKYYSCKNNIQLIPIRTIDDDYKELYRRIFSYNSNHPLSNYIYFDVPSDLGDIAFKTELANILEGFQKKVGEKISVKLHPRSKVVEYQNSNQYQFLDSQVPWEIISMNHNLDDKVIISFFSTTQVSNKIIFDEEPYVIYLFEMKELSEYNILDYKAKTFTDKVEKDYKIRGKVYYPSNMEELEEISLLIKKELEDKNK
ncbi:hypothetical protein AWM75_07785 [Aerococcus urinaehominis]|uniref:Uncharacterized protein n=1 Tax=Aerococcus urinaehominis TaxID=128944 RepID=A0A0X8FM59_9LACT|nr:polysialyltransferase family glycosyltransferase [Aerococcus urinaehominis]AMB99872.1 hypothetical protein AWM75_07785 [Aerococcus urinaehominis]SDM54483.1 hypothetical protein SAMN04487985_12217 [Aerococcus urinaehominis]